MKKNKKTYAYLLGIFCVFIVAVILLTVAIHAAPSVDNSTEPTVTVAPATTATEPTIVLIDEPILFSELFCYEFDSVESIEAFISDVDIALDILISECSIANKYTVEAITLMLEETDRLCIEQSNAILQKEHMLLWHEKEVQYTYATRTWKYLKELGYSDVACAGILGNLMAECGGHTLNLNPFLYDKASGKYYGMFQWSTFYYPSIEGASFEAQLDYYAQTSIPIFKTWGKNYAEGFTLDDFNELSDPRETALAFAKIYERCASWTYERRQDFAEVAYQYFVLDFESIS